MNEQTKRGSVQGHFHPQDISERGLVAKLVSRVIRIHKAPGSKPGESMMEEKKGPSPPRGVVFFFVLEKRSEGMGGRRW